jgi:predicted alpha/beta-hydrolase family hydrolase
VTLLHIPTGSFVITASVHGRGPTGVILGHGAGGDRRTGFLVRCAEALGSTGRTAVLFNFPYTEARRRAPDPPPVLEASVEAVASHVRRELGVSRVVLGGKSMGGRIASQAVAGGTAADGLVFLGYPLHPPGKPDRLRDRHLGAIRVPMLFLQGTRDAFATWDLIATVVGRLGDRARLDRIEDADHSFGVPKRSGRSREEVEADLWQRLASWLDSLGL